jgi:hypothetical protein
MAEIIAKLFYTAILLSVAGFCVVEAYLAWFERSVQYGSFAATKDGENVDAAGNAFRRLIVQQQRRLLALYQPDTKSAKAGEFRAPGEAIHIQKVSDLGYIPNSLLDQLKIEAAGVNVTSILSTLRRWVRPPNEITGSVDQVEKTFYVTANWPHSPLRDGSGTEARAFVLSPQNGLEPASFDVACRIFFARIASFDVVWKDVSENDFCAFSRALAWFQDYVNQRNSALSDDERKAAREGPLAKAQAEIDRLTSGTTTLVFAYKLGGYIDIERFGAVKPGDAAQIKATLDQAEMRFKDYLTRISAINSDAKDADAQERIAWLAARRGQMVANQQVSASSKDFLGAIVKAGLAVAPKPAGPGASIGPENVLTAGTLCCFVKDTAGKTYLITVNHIAGKVGTNVVSPANIDQAKSEVIGTVAKVVGFVALVEVAQNVPTSNGDITGLASGAPLGATLTLVGRTSKEASGKVRAIDVSFSLGGGIDGPAMLEGAIEAERMSSPGDGGAPVLDASKKLVGMLVAGSDRASLILPLKPILDREGLSLL